MNNQVILASIASGEIFLSSQEYLVLNLQTRDTWYIYLPFYPCFKLCLHLLQSFYLGAPEQNDTM